MHKKIFGFSLIELIISLTIISILMLVIMPSMHDLFSRNSSNLQVDKIFSNLQFARAEAIKRGNAIVFCKSKNNVTCDLDDDNDWSEGQIIINQQNNVLIRVLDKLPMGDKLFWSSTFGKNNLLNFLPSGTTGDQQGTFLYCHFENDKQVIAKAIIVQDTGHIRISDLTIDDKPIVCK